MQGMRNIVLLGVSSLLIAGTAAYTAKRLDTAPTPAPVSSAQASRATEAAEATKPISGLHTLAVPSDRAGHYRVDATIRGRRLDFLVDTGASLIALTQQDADRLGLNPAPRDYTLQIQTANGTVRAAQVRLAMVEIGPLLVRDVAAIVMPEGALSQNLLGMSFLSRLRRFEFRTGQLVLEQ